MNKMYMYLPESKTTIEVGSDIPLRLLKHRVPSLQTSTDENDLTISNRVIEADFVFEGIDNTDYYLIQHEIYPLFIREKPYYIYFQRMPSIMYRVLCEPFKTDKFGVNGAGSFTLNFHVQGGYGRSRGTTLSPFTFDTELWQIGMGIPHEDLKYSFKENIFRVYNAGHVTIDPDKKHELIIALKCEGLPRIKNHTTGSLYQFNKAMKYSDKLVLKGIKTYLNNDLVSKYSNHKVIKLAVGWNDIEISGCANPEASFDFPFLY